MEKLRPREGKRIIPCCTANREQSQNRDPISTLLDQAPWMEHLPKSLGPSPFISVTCPYWGCNLPGHHARNHGADRESPLPVLVSPTPAHTIGMAFRHALPSQLWALSPYIQREPLLGHKRNTGHGISETQALPPCCVPWAGYFTSLSLSFPIHPMDVKNYRRSEGVKTQKRWLAHRENVIKMR